ncbi:MAG: VWA domain-containing protein [Bacteroidales bacterium]|nr:VWA domain-containing protein [Bacteroidales bacterium]MCF8344766.1 VWA domain-containing protein [Bacteroidales bacterium]MCF8375694.1 VWA domain-containing protein [Bacteroidales bacterium]MCF8400294.1 VWA domain-containing protein [Bacteroidales bacterium]
MLRLFKYVLLFLLVVTGLMAASAQDNNENNDQPVPLTRILFLFDGSQSMYASWQSDVKINIARKLLINILDSLKTIDHVEVALRVYGHQHQFPPQVCNDTKLEVPFAPDNIEQIKYRLKSINPKGTTPIAFAMEKAVKDFPSCDNCRKILVLITDGKEECGGDPCEVSRKLQKNGVILKPFIIGIGQDFSEAFNCVGNYFDASSEEQFRKALNIVITQALNSTTSQVNLLDSYGNPTETNVNMTFYDESSGKAKYNYIHTLNNKGVPDTLYIDHIPVYKLVVHTIPPVSQDNIKLTNGKHNIIALDAPQGYLKLTFDGLSGGLKDVGCIIRKAGGEETIHVQNLGQTEKYLTGYYDLEILSLPRMKIDSVEIRQSHTTTVEIPLPGIAVIKKTTLGYGSLYAIEGNRLNWIYNFRDDSPQQETLILQPGKYKITFRPRYSDQVIFTKEKSFMVESGKSINVKLYNN